MNVYVGKSRVIVLQEKERTLLLSHTISIRSVLLFFFYYKKFVSSTPKSTQTSRRRLWAACCKMFSRSNQNCGTKTPGCQTMKNVSSISASKNCQLWPPAFYTSSPCHLELTHATSFSSLNVNLEMLEIQAELQMVLKKLPTLEGMSVLEKCLYFFKVSVHICTDFT